jgi:hypothetical protein
VSGELEPVEVHQLDPDMGPIARYLGPDVPSEELLVTIPSCGCPALHVRVRYTSSRPSEIPFPPAAAGPHKFILVRPRRCQGSGLMLMSMKG